MSSSFFNSERQRNNRLPIIRRDKINEILLLDFDIEARSGITAYLESQGIEVAVATDLETAYPLLKYKSFDFILFHWSVENESLINLLRTIQASGKRMSLFYYTDSKLEEEQKKAIEVDASSYSINHVDTHSLLKVIFLNLELN
jgi:DNA-binding response OmpR family regulator